MDKHHPKIKLAYRFSILLCAFTLGFIIYGVYSFHTLQEVRGSGPLYQSIRMGNEMLADILPPPEYAVESYLAVTQLIASKNKQEQETLIATLQHLKQDYDTRYAYWLEHELGDEISQAFLQEAHQPAVEFYNQTFTTLIPAVQAGNQAAIDVVMPEITSHYNTHRKAIDKTTNLLNAFLETTRQQAEQRTQFALEIQAGILLLSLAVSIIIALFIIRHLLKTLGGEPELAAELTRAIAHGDLSVKIPVNEGDTSSLIAELATMQKALNRLIREIQDATHQLFEGSHSLSDIANAVATRAKDQNKATAAIATTIEQVSANINHVTENAVNVHNMVIETGQLSNQAYLNHHQRHQGDCRPDQPARIECGH